MSYKILQNGSQLLILSDSGSSYQTVSKDCSNLVLSEFSITQNSLINSEEFKTVAEVSNNFPENIRESIEDFFS